MAIYESEQLANGVIYYEITINQLWPLASYKCYAPGSEVTLMAICWNPISGSYWFIVANQAATMPAMTRKAANCGKARSRVCWAILLASGIAGKCCIWHLHSKTAQAPAGAFAWHVITLTVGHMVWYPAKISRPNRIVSFSRGDSLGAWSPTYFADPPLAKVR